MEIRQLGRQAAFPILMKHQEMRSAMKEPIHRISSQIQSNPPSATTHISVSGRSLGGGVIRWYSDEAENRYQAGNPEADPAIYTNTNKSFGLHGELSEEHQKLASSEARLLSVTMFPSVAAVLQRTVQS